MANSTRTAEQFMTFLSFGEAAKLLGCEPSVVRRLVMETGEIAAVRFTPNGRRLLGVGVDYLRDMDMDRISDDGDITAKVPDHVGANLTEQCGREVRAGVLRIERAELQRYAGLDPLAGTRERAEQPTNQILAPDYAMRASLAKAEAERDALADELAELKKKPATVTNTGMQDLNPKSYNKAVRVIAGLVMSGWRMRVHDARLTGITDVLGDLDLVGVQVDEGTLRTWLKDGANLIPPPPKA